MPINRIYSKQSDAEPDNPPSQHSADTPIESNTNINTITDSVRHKPVPPESIKTETDGPNMENTQSQIWICTLTDDRGNPLTDDQANPIGTVTPQ